jgi:hypothetical protein
MGQELSCPCDCSKKQELTEEKPKLILDITETLLLGKLQEREVIFEKVCGDWKVMIIKTCDLIRFFNTKKLRLIYNKKEIFYYYSTVYVTNYLSNDLSFVIFKHVKGEEDKSNKNFENRNTFKRKSISLEDKSIFKVENLNLVSNEKTKIKQHILAELNSNLSKDFIFCGIIADSDEIPSPNAFNSSLIDLKSSFYSAPIKKVKSLRSFQLVYKRVFMRSMLRCSYEVEVYEGELNEKAISKVIHSEKYQSSIIKAIMLDCYESNRNVYYFIFCKNEGTPVENVQYTLIQMDKGKDKDMMYAEDIARKLEFIQNKFNLTCVVTDYVKQKFYFIMVDLDFDVELETSKEYILQQEECD